MPLEGDTLFRIPSTANCEEAARAVRDADHQFPHVIIGLIRMDAANKAHPPSKCGRVFVE